MIYCAYRRNRRKQNKRHRQTILDLHEFKYGEHAADATESLLNELGIKSQSDE